MIKRILFIAIIFSCFQLSTNAQAGMTKTQHNLTLARADGSGFPIKTGQLNNIRKTDLLNAVRISYAGGTYKYVSFKIDKRQGGGFKLESRDGKFTPEMKTFINGQRKFGVVHFVEIKVWNDPAKKIDCPDMMIKVI